MVVNNFFAHNIEKDLVIMISRTVFHKSLTSVSLSGRDVYLPIAKSICERLKVRDCSLADVLAPENTAGFLKVVEKVDTN